MQLIDLHVHSTASDGTLTPTEVTKLALQCGLTAYALTDHDTVDGVAEAMQAAENTSLTVIPGAEFSSPYEGKEIHILGLYLNPHCPELLSALRQVREIRNLGDGKKYYRPKQMIEPEEAIRLIRVAGGLPALAHPLQYKLGWKKTEQLLSYLKEAGMMGIEVYYSSHSQSDSLHLREIASRLGSGYGGLRVSALLLDNIKARLQQKNS